MPDDVGLNEDGQSPDAMIVSTPKRRRKNLDWISCDNPPPDLTSFEKFTRDVDWENTFFGHVASWDEQLRTAVLMCLADPDPAALLWGNKQHIIYNEAYTPLVGQIHPQLQGQEPRPIFGDHWDDYEENYRKCEATGGYVAHPSLLTLMTRHGYEEECYFSFKWAPFIGKDGNLTGVYASCSDSTEMTILTRRVNFVRELATIVAPATDFVPLWELLSTGLQSAPIDLPTVMIYSKLGHVLYPSHTSTFHLEASIGVSSCDAAAPPRIVVPGFKGYAPIMQRAATTRSIMIMQASNGEVPTEILQELEPRSFGLRSTELAVCPIFSGVEAVCFIIVGLNPKKRFCAAYQSFLQRLTSEIIGPRVGSILLAHEQERGRILTQQAEDERTLRIHELEQSEMKYRRFAEHAPLGMVRLDTKGDLVYANAAWKVIFGFTPGDSHSRPWLKRIHPDHVELAQQFFEDVCQNKGPVTIEHRLIWIVNKDREEDHRNETQPAWLLVTGYLEDDNHVVCWVTDISAQKAAAMALNEKMEEAILQRTRQENFIDMISHEIRNPMSAVLHCTEDIIGSANKLLKQQDIATLPPILSGCLESAQTILYCIQHQKRIIDDVLTLSKLDADLLEIALVPVEPRKVIQTSLKIFDRELKDSKIKLKIIEDASLDALDICVLMLDPNRFLQIIVNLVTNGIKFTRTSRRKEITVRISASTTRPTLDNVRFFPPIKKPTKANDAVGAATNTYGTGCEQLYLAVSVSDTGKGLSDNERQHLFNKFAQASPKTHIEYGGSGLGLFISRHITEMMNGQIGVAHGQQEGCTFAFFVQTQRVAIDDASEQTLLVAATDRLTVNVTHHPVSPMLSPTATSAEPTRPRSISSPQHPVSPPMESGNAITDTTTRPRLGTVQSDLNLRLTPTMRKAKILVVEDNLINQKVVCKQLRARGYDVHAANHGVEALQALQDAATTPSRETRYFSIVLCDIEMPIMNGLMCAQEVRKLEQEKRLPGHIPMVAVTANARGLHVDKAFEAGMDDVTTKPYHMEELVAQIERFVAKQEVQKPQDG